jgi:homocysteine S-methyltransferase
MISQFESFINKQGFVILDGALATELEARGANLNHALWSAKLLSENPSLIQQVHEHYLQVGANVIATASYQASFLGFEKQGYTKEEAIHFLQYSVQLALDARQNYTNATQQNTKNLPLIAASIGPYGAALADGSEYTGYKNVSVNELMFFHEERLSVLANTAADILAFETIPCVDEAIAIKELLKSHPMKQAWVSFSCKDGKHLSSGELFEDAVRLLDQSPQIIGIGVNCTAPEHILSLIQIAKPLTRKTILVYPNKGEVYNPIDKVWEPANNCSLSFIDNAKLWLAAGATAIGGCCRTSPEDIELLSELIKNEQSKEF